MNNKIIALLGSILMLTSMAGFAYAHWSETLYITGTVTTARLVTIIDSYKVLSPYDDELITAYLSPDQCTLQITCENVFPCWYVWVGFNIHNVGTLPATVKPPIITYEDPDNLKSYLTVELYFYGPYDDGDFKVVWGKMATIENLPFPNSVEPPVPIDPCQHVIVWIWIHFDTDDPAAMGKTVKITITIVDDPFYL